MTECYRELPNFNEAWLRQQGYENVFTDGFDGDSLNLDVWEYRANGARRSGYNAPSQISVKNGNLVLTGEYLTDGEYGEGWYAGMIALKQWYRYGYYKAEIRCNENLRKNADFWSAFWIQASSPYDPAQSQGGIGPGGSELDIMENWGPDAVSCTIWVSGYEGNEGLDSDSFEVRYMGNDYSQEFHTFALLWDEDYYHFYVDDILVGYTSFGYGTSHVEEQVILSLELPAGFSVDPGTVREMLVNSIEIWQKPAAEE